MKFLAILMLVIALALAQTAEQRKTAELVSNVIGILGQDKVERYCMLLYNTENNFIVKCILAQTCSNCTCNISLFFLIFCLANLECAWVSASTAAGISITDDDTKEVALTASNVNFCWWGSLTGMYYRYFVLTRKRYGKSRSLEHHFQH